MSGEKDTAAPATTPGRARATLKSIRLMTPSPHLVTADEVLRVTMFGNTEKWVRISGSGDSAWFELESAEE